MFSPKAQLITPGCRAFLGQLDLPLHTVVNRYERAEDGTLVIESKGPVTVKQIILNMRSLFNEPFFETILNQMREGAEDFKATTWQFMDVA